MVRNGKKAMQQSTAGWHLCVQWLDGSTLWQSLKDLRESYPLQVAEYEFMQGINNEPAFKWWVNFVLKKRGRIIKLVRGRQAKYLKKRFKLGIEIQAQSNRPTISIRRMGIPCGLTQLKERWRMSELLLG